jgi:uncharacterized protein YprB with RNaseH-like and TPR domain
MDLKQRLAKLKPKAPQAGHSVVESGREDDTIVEFGERIEPLPATPSATALADRMSRHRPRREHAVHALDDAALADCLEGTVIAEGLIAVEKVIALPASHGKYPLAVSGALALPYSRTDSRIDAEQLLFLDTETSGLAGGTGTVPFLVGLARFEGAALRIRQLFLTGFQGEPALLAALAAWVNPRSCIVSFNGKSFDVPLLATRFRLARARDPLADLEHLDLLHPTRSAFARKWDDCRLQTAESRLLGLDRDDDLPGHLIPYAWFNFVRMRVLGEVPAILAHNALDVRALPALLNALKDVYVDPQHKRADALGVARAHRRRGAEEDAVRVLSCEPEQLDERALLELASLYRRRGEWSQAITIWQQLDAAGCLAATEALAKYFEHHAQDPRAALSYTEKLATAVWPEASHETRRARLRRKIERLAGGDRLASFPP